MKLLSNILKRTVAARAGEALVEQLPVDRRTLSRIGWLMDPKHLKLLVVVAIGGSLTFSLLGSIRRSWALRRTVAGELKKQLDPINKKLDELEEQNEELKKQNKQLRDQLARANG